MITIVSYIIVLGGFVCLLYWIYDGAIVPSVRLRIRYRLFELRDELRELKLENSDTLSRQVFSDIQGVINTSVAILPELTMCQLIAARKSIANDAKLRRRIEGRKNRIEKCKNQKVREIDKQVSELLFHCFCLNSFLLAMEVLPIIFAAKVIHRINGVLKDMMFIKESELPRLQHTRFAYIGNASPSLS